MSDDGFIQMKKEFEHTEESRQYLGSIYLDLKSKYGDSISITYMDPRNSFSIAGYFIRQWRRKHISMSSCLKHTFFKIKFDAIFINGLYLENLEEFDKIINNYLNA
ncbi:hypothetical protein ACLIA0_03535 [Bacillaceae bacterium W0354]